MVSKENIDRISELYGQYQTYQDALAVLEQDARITAFIIEGTITTHNQYAEGESGSSDTVTTTMATISAEGIQYPPQMMAAIKQQVQSRIDAINKELTELGVTVEQPA